MFLRLGPVPSSLSTHSSWAVQCTLLDISLGKYIQEPPGHLRLPYIPKVSALDPWNWALPLALTSCDCGRRDTGLEWLLYCPEHRTLRCRRIEHAECRGKTQNTKGTHTHTHSLSLSLCDTYTPTHSLCFSDTLSPQMNMLYAGKKLNTEGTHIPTHSLTFSLLRWVLPSQHKSLCWMMSVPVQLQYKKARICGLFCLYCIPQSGNYEKYSFRWKRRQKYKTILILIGK